MDREYLIFKAAEEITNSVSMAHARAGDDWDLLREEAITRVRQKLQRFLKEVQDLGTREPENPGAN